jgi:hypothetical protein
MTDAQFRAALSESHAAAVQDRLARAAADRAAAVAAARDVCGELEEVRGAAGREVEALRVALAAAGRQEAVQAFGLAGGRVQQQAAGVQEAAVEDRVWKGASAVSCLAPARDRQSGTGSAHVPCCTHSSECSQSGTGSTAPAQDPHQGTARCTPLAQPRPPVEAGIGPHPGDAALKGAGAEDFGGEWVVLAGVQTRPVVVAAGTGAQTPRGEGAWRERSPDAWRESRRTALEDRVDSEHRRCWGMCSAGGACAASTAGAGGCTPSTLTLSGFQTPLCKLDSSSNS